MKVLSCAYLLTRTWVSSMLNATKKKRLKTFLSSLRPDGRREASARGASPGPSASPPPLPPPSIPCQVQHHFCRQFQGPSHLRCSEVRAMFRC